MLIKPAMSCFDELGRGALLSPDGYPCGARVQRPKHREARSR